MRSASLAGISLLVLCSRCVELVLRRKNACIMGCCWPEVLLASLMLHARGWHEPGGEQR